MHDYLWGRRVESEKLLLTRAMFFGDTETAYDDIFKKYHGTGSIHDTYAYYHQWRLAEMGMQSKSDSLQRLQQLQQLEQLQWLEWLRFSVLDYRDLEIEENDVVYLDPPYIDSGNQYDGFDHAAFHKWLLDCPAKNIYISEYTKLPHTEVAFNLGKKQSFTAVGRRHDELLLKVVK